MVGTIRLVIFLYPTGATKQHVLIVMMMLGSNKSVEMKTAMAMQNFLKWPLQPFFTILQLDIMTTHTRLSRMAHMNPLCAFRCKVSGLKCCQKLHYFDLRKLTTDFKFPNFIHKWKRSQNYISHRNLLLAMFQLTTKSIPNIYWWVSNL